MRTANYTDLRTNLKGYINSVVDDCDTVLIDRGNSMGVVMASLEECNLLKETEYIMPSERTMNDIHKGKEDLEAGKGIEVNLDELRDWYLLLLYKNTGNIGKRVTPT